MKTKENVIKEAYGEYWESVKDFVNENGWFEYDFYSQNKSKKYKKAFDFVCENIETECNSNVTVIRPKSLQGIENNNGWIKIQSEEDLPKDEENLDYWVMEDEQIVHAKFMHESKKWYCDIDLNLRLLPSHYQPMVKPKPPIY